MTVTVALFAAMLAVGLASAQPPGPPGVVPNVVGQNEWVGSDQVQAAGYPVTEITWYSTQPFGTVLGMNPTGPVAPGTQVTLYVSNGVVPPTLTFWWAFPTPWLTPWIIPIYTPWAHPWVRPPHPPYPGPRPHPG
ncbi:MAG: PASTA domain-containing protein, partial [Mycobacteriaceae bacterium]|nr:PASTA domain-containing protein [Mycobacteriaceae bacterium]